MTELRRDIERLTELFGKETSAQERQKRYRSLVMKYHPDTNPNADSIVASNAMALINMVYAALSAGVAPEEFEFPARGVGDQDRGSRDQKAYVLLKQGDQFRDRAMSIIEAPYDESTNAQVVAAASALLYRAQAILSRVLTAYPDSVWAHDAESKMDWCGAINERITRRLDRELSGMVTTARRSS